MWVSTGLLLGFVVWFIQRYIVTSFYVVNQGEALKQICADPEVAQALFEILQINRIGDGKAKVTVMPPRSELLATLVAARQGE